MERSIERAGLNGDRRALTSPVCFGLLIARPVLMAPKLMVSDGFGRYAIKNSARRPRPQKKKEKEKEKLTRCFYFSLTKLPVVGLFELSVID
jgi:hypothetical protein